MDEFLAQFLIEARELLTAAAFDVGTLRRDPENRKCLDSAFRAFHTLKGSVALFDMAPAGQVLHAAEDLLDQARKKTIKLDEPKLAALLACLDRVDVWVDAMESKGALPANAAAEAQALLARLGRQQSASVQATPADSDWLSALLARDFDAALIDAGGLTAFRYEPDEQCFFRGDDPLAIVAAVPKLAAVKVMPRGEWPALADLQPFSCMLVVEGLSHAGLDEVQLAFRLVGDQAKIAEVAPERGIKAEDSTIAGAARSLRIDAGRIDTLADGVGELVVAGNALAPLVAEAMRLDSALGTRLRQVQAAFERGIGDMHRSVTAMRMVPIGPAVRRLPRVVRDLSDTLGRDVDFAIEGEQVECEKGIADAIYEPLLHLIRNSLDHGIEMPAVRAAAGKPSQGILRLRFSRAADQLISELEDDGAGIDPARVRRIAIERGLLSEDQARALSDEEAQALIFAAGFSTAAQVSDISGRGVGMDAVKAALDPLGARIEVRSRVGQGTLVRIALPLSAITTRMLIVEAGLQRYAVPFESVAETVIVPSERIVPLGDHHAVVLRDRTLPVVHLRELLGEERSRGENTKLMVTWAGNEQVAVAVDGFGERIEAMIKPAAGLLAGYAGLSGITLLGTGDVMLVLDVEALVT